MEPRTEGHRQDQVEAMELTDLMVKPTVRKAYMLMQVVAAADYMVEHLVHNLVVARVALVTYHQRQRHIRERRIPIKPLTAVAVREDIAIVLNGIQKVMWR